MKLFKLKQLPVCFKTFLHTLNSMAPSSFSWAWPCAVFMLVAYFVYLLRKKSSLCLPPGPKGLPIVGNLFMLGALPHRVLAGFAQQYGPIMHLQLGFIHTIVVSSPQAAELFLRTHDRIFSGRPYNQAAGYISYDTKGLTFSSYGSYWRNTRRVCALELLNHLKIDAFKHVRTDEMNLFIESLKEASTAKVAVDLSTKLKGLNTDISFRMVLGKKLVHRADQEKFSAVVHEGMHLAAFFNIADYFPYVGALNLQGKMKRIKAVHRFYDDILDKIIEEHVRVGPGGGTPPFIDMMMSYMESKENDFLKDRSNVKAIVLDMLLGAMDTASTAIEWVMAELIKHPSLMKKVRQEVDGVVGLDRMLDESDLVHLEYLDMVIKETFRIHPVAPLLIPHSSMEDCTVNGYQIPRNSRIIINTFAIGRDPEAWPDPDEFKPERFVGKNMDYKGSAFQFLPFGSGRRGCPGITMGVRVVRLVVAQLVHCFDWELPNGMVCTELDMDEDFGLTVARANPLLVIPTYRLRI